MARVTQEWITLTLGDMAENHKGMEQIGDMVAEGEGFNVDDLYGIQLNMEAINAECELITLSEDKHPEAYVLVIKDGINKILGNVSEYTQMDMFEEQKELNYDKKAFMYGRVVNKHARWNLCFDENSREPSYEDKMGRIVGYEEVPIMKLFMEQLPMFIGEKANGLKVESNYYYDINKCGIGFHGDSERRKVIGLRIGTASLPLHYQWYYKGVAEGERMVIPLEEGDMYIMSEKAVGTDWKKKNVYTLRHATGKTFVNK